MVAAAGKKLMDDLFRRKAEIDRIADSDSPVIDPKELAERMEKANAMAVEDEKHLVDYCQDCKQQSIDGWKDIRETMAECWAVYNENEPVSYGDKEDWQARIVVPRPFQTVQYGAAAVKKAFSPNFLSVESASDEMAAEFWQSVMEYYLNEQHANFPIRFTDANVMALAIGISQELIPRWVPRRGLEFALVEPWKIYRDPDAQSRDSQSGLFWIHQEWLDFHVLKNGEESGRYFDVERVRNFDGGEHAEDDPFMTKEAIRARKEQVWDDRSQYRKMILTSEFWGTILDKQANVILPSGTFTVAGGRVIQKPKEVSLGRFRWPGVSFSPLPDILRYGGRGLLKGVLTVWQAMNDIMCLHQDNLVWVVNPMTEINTDGLQDPSDVNTWPGKDYLTKDTVSGNQVVRTVERKSRTNEVLANMQYYDQHFQRGTFVPDNVQGLPGWRQDITFREAAMNLDQALGVYALMGENIEGGAIDAVELALVLTQKYAGYQDYEKVFAQERLQEFIQSFGLQPDEEQGVVGVPGFDGRFHISGIQALMKNNETLQNLKEVVIPLSRDPRYARYIKPYQVIKAIETRTNLKDEGVFASEIEAQYIEKQQALEDSDNRDALQKLQDLQEALGVAELIEKLQGIEAGDIQSLVSRIDELEMPNPEKGGQQGGSGSEG